LVVGRWLLANDIEVDQDRNDLDAGAREGQAAADPAAAVREL
jgi:hypothetical protein